MMNREEFKESLNPMAQAYGEMGKASFNIYYDILKKHNTNIFNKAVYNVLEFHKYKNWPPIGVFSEAIENIKRESSVPTVKELKKRYDYECPVCLNMGWELTEKENGYKFAKYCQCETGQKMKIDNKSYYKNR